MHTKQRPQPSFPLRCQNAGSRAEHTPGSGRFLSGKLTRLRENNQRCSHLGVQLTSSLCNNVTVDKPHTHTHTHTDTRTHTQSLWSHQLFRVSLLNQNEQQKISNVKHRHQNKKTKGAEKRQKHFRKHAKTFKELRELRKDLVNMQ